MDVDFHLGLADLGLDPGDELNDLLDLLVCEQDRAEHFLFGDLVCASFDHHDGLIGAGNGQLQTALFTLCKIGV